MGTGSRPGEEPRAWARSMGTQRRPYITSHAAAVAPDRVAALTRGPHRSVTQGNGEKWKMKNVFSSLL